MTQPQKVHTQLMKDTRIAYHTAADLHTSESNIVFNYRIKQRAAQPLLIPMRSWSIK